MVMIVLSICNVAVHSIGCHLLRYIAKNVEQSPQTIYVLHLSGCEILFNITASLTTILKMVPWSYAATIHTYIDLVYLSGPWLVYFVLMCSITLDRLLQILLHLKYPKFWNETKAKKLIKIGWIAGGMFTVFTCFYQKFFNNDIREIYFTYWYPSFHIFFVILTITTYIVIFKHFKRSRVAPCQSVIQRGSVNHLHQISTFRTFLKSRFYVSVLLIGTYVIFVVVPDSIYLFYGYLGNNKNNQILDTLCYLSYILGTSSDAYIYIFVQTSVRKLLWKKLRIYRQTNNNDIANRALPSTTSRIASIPFS